MGVWNAVETVERAVRSILDQSLSDFEFVIIDDGSTDETPAILEGMQRNDRRITVARQENAGLTRSLATGCAVATGKYIARQDADDVSLPDRLLRQVEALERRPTSVLATCWVEDATPEGTVCEVYRELRHVVPLRSGEDWVMTGIAAHGSVLMRRDALTAAGGYRDCFYFAQDSDLWLRLAELGEFSVVPEVLYRRVFRTDCISSRFGTFQSEFCDLAQQAFRARRTGTPEEPFLAQARRLAAECRVLRNRKATGTDRATSLLLVASRLAEQEPRQANRYLLQALRNDPLHLRSWKALLKCNASWLLRSARSRLRAGGCRSSICPPNDVEPNED